MNVYQEVQAERNYQDEKWGTQFDDKNTPWQWMAYIAQYSVKWNTSSPSPMGTNVTDAFRTCMVKVAALAVAAIESIDRQRANNGKTIYEE